MLQFDLNFLPTLRDVSAPRERTAVTSAWVLGLVEAARLFFFSPSQSETDGARFVFSRASLCLSGYRDESARTQARYPNQSHQDPVSWTVVKSSVEL